MGEKRFHKVNVEIGNVCNLQCSFCPEVLREKRFMTPEFFEGVLLQIAPLTDLVCFHLMGDPLVHPQLDEFVRLCERHSVPVFMVTNGVLLREKQHRLLLSPSMHQVNFSLHSFADNYGNKDPSSYLERIFNYTDDALRARPELYINYRLWNLQEARGVGEHNLAMLARIEQRFGVRLDGDLDVRRGKSVKITGRLYLHFDTEFTWPSLDLPVMGQRGRCHGLSSHFGILADGTVVPCCLDKEGRIPLGKIQERPIVEILADSRAQAMLRGFHEGRLVEDLCQRCQYIERFA